MQVEVGGAVIELAHGDITRVEVDAIVNAANSALVGGGGVDGAIHRAGGPSIMDELGAYRKTGGCPTGSAVPTGAGRLKAKYVFHAVGPVYRGGESGEVALLASCYRTCLELAAERGVETIAFPSISTGVYGYPVREAARVAIGAVQAFLVSNRTPVKRVLFVLYDAGTLAAYQDSLGAVL
jgi:O-acetyl-ADP-ribose deacetylase (regulator of RNase III)